MNPKFVWAPFDASLLTAAKTVFQDARISSCYFYFVKALWKQATKLKLKKKNLIKMTRKLIHAVKSFSLINPKSVDEKYTNLKRKVLNQFLSLCPRYEYLFRYIERCFMLSETEDGVKRGFANMFPIQFWNFQWIKKNIKMNTIINYGAEDFTKIQSRYFAFTNPELDQIVSAFQDLEATKKIEFEDKPRDIQAVEENSIELGQDIEKWEMRVGHETSYCVRFLKNDDSIHKRSVHEYNGFYVSEDEMLTREDEEDELPISLEKKIEANKEIPIVWSELSNESKPKSATKVKIAESNKQNKKKSKENEKDDDKRQKTGEFEETNVKQSKKPDSKDKNSSSQVPSNQNTLTLYATKSKESIVNQSSFEPKQESLINENMTIEEILQKLDIIEYLEIFQQNKITPQNLKLLEISDLRELKIPIGPARQIVNEFALLNSNKNIFIPKSSNLDKYRWNKEFRRSSSNEKEPIRSTVILPQRRRGPQKPKPSETLEDKKERDKDDRKKKRDEKLKEKDKSVEDKIKERLEGMYKQPSIDNIKSEINNQNEEWDPNYGSMMKHLVKIDPNQRTCPKLQEEKEKETINQEISSLVKAKPLETITEENDNVDANEEWGTSQDTLKSDEPFL